MSTTYDTYTVEISVPSAEFSEQGITLDDRRFTAMLHNAFPLVRMSELNARVLKPTDPQQIEALPECLDVLRELLGAAEQYRDSLAWPFVVERCRDALRKAGVL